MNTLSSDSSNFPNNLTLSEKDTSMINDSNASSNSADDKNRNTNNNESKKIFFAEHNQISDFSFYYVKKIDDLLNKSQFDQIDTLFKDFKQLSTFLNYFSGFLSYQEINNLQDQDILVNVLSFLLFRNIDMLHSFIPLAINLLVGGPKKLFKPTKTQRMISLRYFLQYFNEKWFDYRYSDSEYFLLSVFKNMSPTEDPGYYMFLTAIVDKIPNNSKYISGFIEVLFNSHINSPIQFKFVNDLARKSPQNLPYFSILFYIKNSVNGIFTRISHHYLIPLILDFYNENEILRLAVWHYLCRFVQFCITVQCLKKQQRMIINKESSNKLNSSFQQQRPFSLPGNSSLASSTSFIEDSAHNISLCKNQYSNSPVSSSPISLLSLNQTDEDSSTCSLSEDYSPYSTPPLASSSSSSLFSDAFTDLDSYSEVVNDIIDLLHILYALHIPLLCRTIYMEIRCAQLSFNFFRKHKFDESFVFLTADEFQKSQYIELPRETIQEIQNDRSISKSDMVSILQKKKEIYYIQHYLYDKQLLKEFHGIRPREINLKRLLEFPVSGIPLKKGIERTKVPPTNTKQSANSKFFACSTLASSLCQVSRPKKSDTQKLKPPSQPQNNEKSNKPAPIIRIRQYFSRESTSASAE